MSEYGINLRLGAIIQLLENLPQRIVEALDESEKEKVDKKKVHVESLMEEVNKIMFPENIIKTGNDPINNPIWVNGDGSIGD